MPVNGSAGGHAVVGVQVPVEVTQSQTKDPTHVPVTGTGAAHGPRPRAPALMHWPRSLPGPKSDLHSLAHSLFLACVVCRPPTTAIRLPATAPSTRRREEPVANALLRVSNLRLSTLTFLLSMHRAQRGSSAIRPPQAVRAPSRRAVFEWSP